ncbi:uncharacterized protein LOC111072436 isoform X2 [Drosophila obscura]|uniref:uncharacterized protein LOC111072436 isoform X2 n=1 Tax=Drosophila obscura TaxID=7282 RepID=UPI001BB0F108|nr:uncharacterized protein LOC111072436 isoform X2 [Drosophila obscura]
MSSPDEPGPSNGRKSRSKRRDKSVSRSSNSSSGSNFGRHSSNVVNGGSLRDRLLVANAMATDETNSMVNGNDKNQRKKKKKKSSRRKSQTGLKGYSGRNPSLSYLQNEISDDSDEDTRDEVMIPVTDSSQLSRKRPKSRMGIKTNDNNVENKAKVSAASIPPSKKKKKNQTPCVFIPRKLICGDDPLPDPLPEVAPRRKSIYSDAAKKPKPNLSDELYRLPFKFGWKREVVTPSPLSNTSNHTIYTSPCGKRCRQISEIVPLLTNELTIEHFIFGTHLLGAGSEFETSRQALSREMHYAALKERRKSLAADKSTASATIKVERKRRQTMGAESYPKEASASAPFGKRRKSINPAESVTEPSKPMAVESTKPLAGEVAALVTGKRVPKPKVPKGASPPTEGWTSTMAVKGNARLLAAASNGNARTAGSSNASGSSNAAPVSHAKRATCGSCLKLIKGSVCQSCVRSSAREEGPNAGRIMDEYEELEEDEEESEESYQAGTVSNGLKVTKMIEPPGEMPPAELFSTDKSPVTTPTDLYMPQEVVVIGGRKAISIVGEPTTTSQPKVIVPNPPDLSSYEEFYGKRIAAPKQLASPTSLWGAALGEGFNCHFLLSLMKTLNQQDRVNCSNVCKLWNLVSRDSDVWKSVSLRDTKVNNWPALVREMARNCTRELDMMGAIIPNTGTLIAGDMRVLTDMRTVRTNHTKADFLHQIFSGLPQLEKLIGTCVSSGLIMTDIDKMENLNELRIRMTDTKASITGLPHVGKLTHLRVLSLRGVKNLGNLLFLKELPNLETLNLGYCQSMHRLQLGNEVLPTLTKLQRFRLETDPRKKTSFPIDEIMKGLAHAGGVRRLELVNVDVDCKFSQLLSNCNTVEELLLIPKCQTNTAVMIRSVMGISRNGSQLKQFKLVLITQLLTATGAMLRNPDVPMVPVIRPIPGILLGDRLNSCSKECQEQQHDRCVAGLPFERLKIIMSELMPNSSPSVVTMAMMDTPTIQLGRLPPDATPPNF